MHHPPISSKNLDKILTFLASHDDFVFLETGKTDTENICSYIFTEPVCHLLLKAQDDFDDFFAKAENYNEEGYYLAGWISYELGYKLEPSLQYLSDLKKDIVLADFGVFPPPIIYNHSRGDFTPHLPCIPTSKIHEDSNVSQSISDLHPNQDREDYLAAINQIKSYITAGDTYQVNYTLKLLFNYLGNSDTLYRMLRDNQGVSYGAYIKSAGHIIQSFSPELFFRKNNNVCTVRPMKGTMARGRTQTEDIDQASTLHNDPKNRSENVMIVDLLRNDLGRLAKMASVKTLSLFDIETFQTLHQMTSTIQGELRPDLSFKEIFKALFPCGSVTGAPKIRTMEIIKELETEPRGVYTGGVGFITPERDMVFNVPIRTLKLENGSGEMGIGSGIIHDSDPENEWQESLLKGQFLTNPMPMYQLIESILWSKADKYWLLDRHMDRLCQSAKYLQFSVDIQTIQKHLTKLSGGWSLAEENNEATGSEQARSVRILLHKDGRFQTTHATCNLPSNITLPITQNDNLETHDAMLSKVRSDSSSPYLFHKTTMRKVYDTEREKAVDNGFTEVIFMNEKDEITEGSISNIIVRKDEEYFTPLLSCGLLPGTFRDHLLDLYPTKMSEKILTKKDLMDADNIYMANSLRGLVEIEVKLT